jgi:soluble P-type ATPase
LALYLAGYAGKAIGSVTGACVISVVIPGFGELKLEHLVCDYNGTLASDGRLISSVVPLLAGLAHTVKVHVLTADTYGRAAEELAHAPVQLTVVDNANQAEAKRNFVERLGASSVVAIGNGRNDRLMLQSAALGIVVIQREGAGIEALLGADIAVCDVHDALGLLRYPMRLIATLRS